MELPYKHFVFGDLYQNYDGDTLRWSYHVAPIIKIKCPGGCTGKGGDLYVLDPVISSEPMLKDDYHAELESNEESRSHITGFVTCKANTFSFRCKCFFPEDPSPTYDLKRFTDYALKM